MLIGRARTNIFYKSESKIGMRTGMQGPVKGDRDKVDLDEKIAKYEDLFGSLTPENYEDGHYTVIGLTEATLGMLRRYKSEMKVWYGDLRISMKDHSVVISSRAVIDLQNNYLISHENKRTE